MRGTARTHIATLLTVLAVTVFGSISGAEAQFVKTGVNVYQDVGGRLKVIVTQGKGLLFLFTPPIALQDFDPSQVRKEGRELSAFLLFDEATRKYTELWVGKRAYRVEGNFSLRFGKYARLIVDNTNPYVSLAVNAGTVTQPDGSPRSYRAAVLGFLGLRPIVNQCGREAAAVFEADQFNLAGVIEPYLLGKGGLYVGGKEVANDRVGALLDDARRRHQCLEPDTARLTERELDRIKGAPDDKGRAELLGRALARCRRQNPISGLLVLRASSGTELNGVILFDPSDSEVKLLSPLNPGSKSKHKVCVIQPIRISEPPPPEPTPAPVIGDLDDGLS